MLFIQIEIPAKFVSTVEKHLECFYIKLNFGSSILLITQNVALWKYMQRKLAVTKTNFPKVKP